MGLVLIDTEAFGGSPVTGSMTEFGAVTFPGKKVFHGILLSSKPSVDPSAIDVVSDGRIHGELQVAKDFEAWLKENSPGRPVFVSDNPAFDFQWINCFLWKNLGYNPLGHSARRISDFWAGLNRDFHDTQRWKRFRVIQHSHNPCDDSLGNFYALETIFQMMKDGRV